MRKRGQLVTFESYKKIADGSLAYIGKKKSFGELRYIYTESGRCILFVLRLVSGVVSPTVVFKVFFFNSVTGNFYRVFFLFKKIKFYKTFV